MRTRPWLIAVLLVSASLPALAASGGVEDAEARAQSQLDASLAELAALREEIAAEKLPLTRRLGELEERLQRLRKENDQVLRDIDIEGLGTTKLESQVKMRADEAAYIVNLLDEYGRNFESRLLVGETERYTPILDAAKEVMADTTLDTEAKMASQVAVVRASIARLDDVVGGTRFAGSAVDPNGSLAEGTFALVGPVAMFASLDGSSAGLAIPQAGSSRPAVRPVDEAASQAVLAIARDGKGIMPFDPSRGGALKELIQRTSIVHIFHKGGPIMWPLLAVSILALATVLERLVFLARVRARTDRRVLADFLSAVDDGRFAEAIAIGNRSKYYVVHALGYALEHRAKSLAGALLYANAQELKRFTRGVSILDTSITIAPLLGLLGTVTGMMASFSLIGGELSAPGAITGGIAEALIATAFGLGIAIVALVPYNFLNSQTEQARHDLEAAGTQLELLAKPWLETVKVHQAELPQGLRVTEAAESVA
jgi:biopolymer transport protein ExbB